MDSSIGTSIQPLYLQIIVSGCDTLRSRLSHRAVGWTFPLATRIINPGYFHQKTKGKYNQKNSLATPFPTYRLQWRIPGEGPRGPAPPYF